MFDDQEENQGEAVPLSARMRFAYRLAGIDPDNDQELSRLPGRMQRGMALGTQAMPRSPNWSPLQRESQLPQKPTIGQRMMKRELEAASGQRANRGAGIAPKWTIGQRMMGLDRREPRIDNLRARQGISSGLAPTGTVPGGLELRGSRWLGDGQNAFMPGQGVASNPSPEGASGRRNNAPAGIAPKLTIGQRMMGIGGRGSRIATPQTRQGSFGGLAPTGALPAGLEMRGNRWLGGVQRDQVRQDDASAGRGLERSGLDLGSEGRLGFASAAKGAAAAGAREQQQPGSGSPVTGDYVTGPKSQTGDTVKRAADYLKWRNQNFRPATGSRWEAPSGRLYTDQQLRELYSTQQQDAVWEQQRRDQERHATGIANRGTVAITYPDGMKETRTGNHPQRDNNPGDIKYAGTFAREHGAVGVDKGFAIFPSAEVGWAALDALLRTNKYQVMSIDEAIKAFAPHLNWRGQVINDTPKYQANVRSALGVSGATKVSSLTPEQFEILKHTIGQIEGYHDKSPGQKGKAIRELPRRPSVIPRN